MASRPANLLYGVDETPPLRELIALTVQHVFIPISVLALPIAIISEIGGGFGEINAVVAMSLIANGIGTILQSMRWRGIGSGYLCPNVAGPNFFVACSSAAWLGGIPLMRGMTICAGLIELFFAGFVRRVAFLFPAEITGLVVFMVGISLVPIALSRFFGVDYAGDPISPPSVAIASVMLFVMLGMNLRGSPQIKLYSMLAGLVLGYGLSYAAGLFSPGAAMNIAQTPWVSVPHMDGMWNFAFRWSLLPTFIIVALSGAVKSMGNLVTCQKINDDHWAGPDMGRVGQGLRADGLAVLIAGLIGGYATDTSSSNVGLSSASAVTSRVIGFSLGGLLIALGFLPKLSAVLAVMPSPVAGAVLLYVTCVMIFSGLQMILTTKPDTRVTFAIGLAMICGFSLTMIPELYMHLPSYLRPIFDSSIALTVVVAVVLNVLFRSMMKQVAPKGEAG